MGIQFRHKHGHGHSISPQAWAFIFKIHIAHPHPLHACHSGTCPTASSYTHSLVIHTSRQGACARDVSVIRPRALLNDSTLLDWVLPLDLFSSYDMFFYFPWKKKKKKKKKKS